MPPSQELINADDDDDIDVDELEKLILANIDGDKNNSASFSEAEKLQKLLEDANTSVKEDEQKESGINEIKRTNQITECNDDLFSKDSVDTTRTENEENLIKEIFGDTNDDDDIDSSDDEGIRNFLERKYNEYGRDINAKLKQNQNEEKERKITKEVIKSSSQEFSSELMNSLNQGENQRTYSFPYKNLAFETTLSTDFRAKLKPTQNSITVQKAVTNTNLNSNVYTDPIFGMRIINPLVSSSVLVERMEGRKAVGMCSVAFHIQRGDLSQDWVIAGALVSKSPVKTAKNGSSYSIWRISDLKGDIKMVSVFLFRSAHTELWKTAVGTVVAILNPVVFEKKQQKGDVACLSIDTSNKVMVIGQSKDLGTCKAKKKNGDTCGAVINLNECDFCLYHMQQEFGRMSKRSELQSATAGRGLNALRNKILGKNEVFYAGQSFTAIPARKSAKLEAKDQKRLGTLSDYFQKSSPSSESQITQKNKEVSYASPTGPQSKIASGIECNAKQRLKDLERLKILKSEDDNESKVLNTNTSTNTNSFSEKLNFSLQKVPSLSKESFSIELNVNAKKAELTKLKALEIIKKKPIKKSDPNFVKYRGTIEGKKRIIDEFCNVVENDTKRRKLQEEEEEKQRKTRIQRIMEATSAHIDLIESRKCEQQEQYFKKMECKEKLEEKMLNTFKVPCKAVICTRCKYTAFSAADRCKDEKHPLKVIDAVKRFFECEDCGNRTVTVHKIPKLSCKNCQSSRWKRTSMLREKKITSTSENLSIRGDEEKFLGALKSTVNLNLLVPEAN